MQLRPLVLLGTLRGPRLGCTSLALGSLVGRTLRPCSAQAGADPPAPAPAPGVAPHYQDDQLAGGIYLVPTPIGNLEDITLRALRVLRGAEVILCEDTRRTRQLLTHFDIPGAARLASFHLHNEWRKQDGVLAQAERGAAVAVVSDAGLPGINDPGGALVAAAVERGISVTVLPGASAVLTAAVASGLPLGQFQFCGFTAHKPAARRKQFDGVRGLRATLIFFVSPHSLVRALEDACAVFGGQRRCCIARELTKVHEELHRNTLAGALAEFTERAPRGEVTLVVEGATEEAPSNGEGVTDEVLLDVLLEAAGSGLSPSQAAKSAAAALGIPRQRAYALLAANPARLKGGEV